MSEEIWFAANRANWDERVPVHLKSYELAALKSGHGHLYPIEEAELTVRPGERVLHLQCHFGEDTLTLAQRGAEVTGIDFSPPAIAAARELAAELGLAARARFVECTVYEAPEKLAEPASFDWVFATWGTINWLPDVARWAQTAAYFLKPGGTLYLADGHPAAYVLDDSKSGVDGMPGWFGPYFGGGVFAIDDARDYSDPDARLQNSRTYEWIHPVGSLLTAVLEAGLRIESFREHDSVPWRMFACLEKGADRLYRWPKERWLPLSFSLKAMKP